MADVAIFISQEVQVAKAALFETDIFPLLLKQDTSAILVSPGYLLFLEPHAFIHRRLSISLQINPHITFKMRRTTTNTLKHFHE